MVFESETFTQAWETAQHWSGEDDYIVLIGQHKVAGKYLWITEIHWAREYWEWKKSHPSQYK